MKTEPIRFALALLSVALLGLHATQAADLHVPAGHASIQAAVNAASNGDTIHIAPGVYREQIEIRDKNLSLIGRPGTIIRAFPNMNPPSEHPSITRRAMVLVDDTPGVLLRNLTFEGDQLGDQQQGGAFNAALFLTSGGVIEDCRFVGIRESIPGLRHCEAIEVFNELEGTPHLQMDIRRNTIVDCYSGIRLLGTRTGVSLTISIVDNVISGVGPSAAWSDMEGIEVQEGIIGEVVRNTVSNFSYVGNGANRHSPLAFGILGISTRFPEDLTELNPIRFENNNLLDNQLHFTLILCNSSTVMGNRIEGDGAGVRRAGLWFTGENVLVEGNDFLDLTEGVRVGGMDPDFGTVPGIAVNAQLKDNRFRNVTTSVNLQPLASATEEATLIHPFPQPVLSITKTVRVSWPDYYAGEYVLESAPTSEGPWTEQAAELRVVDGSLQATVEVNGQQQYFRLQKPE